MNIFNIIIIVDYTLVFIVICGLSTTDVQRLLKGSTTNIVSKNCCCDSCGYVIPLKDQIPVVSYLLSKGRCRNCGAPIPKGQTCQEAFLFVSFMLIGILTGFKTVSVIIDFVYYELYKLIVIIVKNRRRDDFSRQLLLSLLLNLVIFSAIGLFIFAADMAAERIIRQ